MAWGRSEDVSVSALVEIILKYARSLPEGGTAQRAIEQAEVIRLSLTDQECFAQALLSPQQPAPALERAFTRRRKLIQAE